jgi:hypothetical protein
MQRATVHLRKFFAVFREMHRCTRCTPYGGIGALASGRLPPLGGADPPKQWNWAQRQLPPDPWRTTTRPLVSEAVRSSPPTPPKNHASDKEPRPNAVLHEIRPDALGEDV